VKRAKKKRNGSGVRAMRDKHGHESTHHFLQCTLEECAAYLQYKKQDKDPGMPKGLADRRLRSREWMSRPSPPTSPYQSEDEEGEDFSAHAASALLGLACNNPLFDDEEGEEEEEELLHDYEGGI